MGMQDINWSNVIDNALGSVLAALTLAMLGILILDERKFRPWVYNLKPVFRNFVLRFLDFIYHPYVWFLMFFAAITALLLDMYVPVSAIIISVVFLRYYKLAKRQRFAIPAKSSEFSDGFHKVEDIKKSWLLKTGVQKIDDTKGKPSPSLRLELADPPQATNTFMLLKDYKSEHGVIECDAFFGEESILNIVFLADNRTDNWHMARFETREGGSDGFLIKDKGKGVNWRLNNMSGTNTSVGSWHKIKVEFNSEKARMYRNGELIAEILNPQIFGKYMGLFNEVGTVFVDNFTFSGR